MKKLSGPRVWQEVFVPELHRQYMKEVSSTKKFEAMVKKMGGQIYLDHGATRTADPKQHRFLTRIGKAFGLSIVGRYQFPAKKLTAVALGFKDREGFKWFSTLIEYKKFSKKAAELVEEDIKITQNKMSEKGLEYLNKLETKGWLSETEAKAYVKELLNKYFVRQGPPIKRSTLTAIGKESQEAYNALLMGTAFNHIAYTVNELDIKDWYGQEVIEVLYEHMRKNRFKMLDTIQGVPGGVLRQTSTLADKMKFPVLESSGRVGKVLAPGKFLEFIQRGAERDKYNRPKFEGGKIKRFRGFVATNTVKLFDSTK